jgi:hypothetical protein
MGTINSSDRIAATLYSLGTLSVSEIYVYVNTCIKEIVMMMMIIIIIVTMAMMINNHNSNSSHYFPSNIPNI